MKQFNRILFCSLFILIINFSSCEKDDGFHSIRTVEREIHIKVNNYRSSEGLSTLVEQFLVFEEARRVSDRMANGTYTIGDPEIQNVVNEFTQNLGGTTNGWVSLASGIENSDSIVNTMLGDPITREIIRMEYTQSGVGVSQGSDGLFYVCHIFINIPD